LHWRLALRAAYAEGQALCAIASLLGDSFSALPLRYLSDSFFALPLRYLSAVASIFGRRCTHGDDPCECVDRAPKVGDVSECRFIRATHALSRPDPLRPIFEPDEHRF